LIVGVTTDLMDKFPANKIIMPIAELVGGKGGGRADLAEAGGTKPAQLKFALEEAYKIIEKMLQGHSGTGSVVQSKL